VENKIKETIDANIAVHSALANSYNAIEPHFKPESIKRVEDIILEIIPDHSEVKALDLGCGTGFIINILKKYVNEIIGVDVTQAMLDRVDKSGTVKIKLIKSDTGTVNLTNNYFDIATAYSFLDHLYDIKPTVQKAYDSLKKGGKFYADLSPNFYFWKAIKELNTNVTYEQVLQREVNAVLNKGEEIELQFGIKKEIFELAEHQKHIKGGLIEEELDDLLREVGFTQIKFIYHWFVGQAQIMNDETLQKDIRHELASIIHKTLYKSLPISRNLFKYVGFIAIK